MFPRNIGILLPTEAASYPRRGPVLHRCENLKTEVMSSLAKRLSHASIIEITISYTGLFEMIVGVLTTATPFSRCNPM